MTNPHDDWPNLGTPKPRSTDTAGLATPIARPAPEQGERRGSDRIRLDLETAVPVLVRWEGTLQWGVARNISAGGMLIELRVAPNIGSRVEITLAGVRGSADAPDPAVMAGEVRHHVAWNFRGREGPSGFTAIGIRFVDELESSAPPLLND